MFVRPATQEDALDAVACVKAVFDEYGFTWEAEAYHADLYNLEEHYHAHGHSFWVAVDEGKVVGTVALERFPKLPGAPGELVQADPLPRIGGCDCALQRLYVPKQSRGRGIGKALFETTINAAVQEGRSAMEIWSDQRFREAHTLYQRFGAVVVGERICDDPDESPEFGLYLAINP